MGKIRVKSEQRKFLAYLCDNHNSIGYSATINYMLVYGTYRKTEIDRILADWSNMVQNPNCEDCIKYGRPTKYLKIKR